MSSVSRSGRWLPAKVGARITLMGMCVTLAVCAVICVGLIVGLHVTLHREVDRFLVGEVHEFIAILSDGRDKELGEVEREIHQEIGSRVLKDLTFRLLDESGFVAITSDPDELLPNPWPGLEAIRESDGEPRFQTIRVARADCYIRCCSQWVRLPDRGDFVVQATYQLQGVMDSLTTFRRLCYVAMAVAALLSLLGGWLLSRRVLRPIHQMTVSARQIGAENLSRRLDQSESDDELDNLAAVLNDMLGRLERQFRQIQQFTADAAHELRTPLAALRGNAEVALSGDFSEDACRRVLETSIDEYDRLTRIAEDLLLLAQADSGRPFLRFGRFCMQAAVRDVVDLFAPLAQDKHISLEIQDGNVPEIDADGPRIRQLISNLIDNAIKHTPEGGAVRITTRQSGDQVELTVTDTGPGIAHQHLPHIFDRFYRADTARSRGAGGAGLGLAICRTIVEGHGGNIEARCDANGTSFAIRLAAVQIARG